MSGRTMLVTGATGVVGAELLDRATAAGWDAVGCSASGGAGVVAWNIGAEPAPEELRRPWSVIVHAAARPDFELTVEEAYAANVAPLLALPPLLAGGTHLVHVSSVYATGYRGSVESTDPADYRNGYEWSKACAEREAAARFGSVTVVRPPIVIGRRGDGAVARFSALYLLVRGVCDGTIPAVAGDPDGLVELVSTCDVARCVLAAAAGPRPDGVALHVLGQGADAPTLATVLGRATRALNRWRAERGVRAMSRPPLVPPEAGAGPLMGAFVPYLREHTAVPVTWRVDPIEECLDASVRWWAQRHPEITLRAVAPWEELVG